MIVDVRAKWAIAGAGLWSVGLLVAAVVVPTSSSSEVSSTTIANGSSPTPGVVVISNSHRALVQADGFKVLIVVAIPLLMVLAVALLLPRHRRIAWAITVVAFLMVPLGAFTIGPFFIPVAILLLVACALDYAFPTPAFP